jgi:hypothetical protein
MIIENSKTYVLTQDTKSVFVLPGKDNPAATLPTNASESASPSAIIE